MTKQRFETALQQLTPRRREVLDLFLVGKNDQEIAQSLYITENTVRQHIRNILKNFNLKNDLDDDHSSQRSNLIALFAQYQPELLQKPVTEAENQSSESILLSNNSDNKQDACTTEVIDNKQDACTTEHDPNFVGREDAIARLNHLIYKNSGTGILPVTRICQIVATGGQGKTTLAKKYLENNFKTVLEFKIAGETKDIASVESLLEEKLRQLGEEPGREFMVSLDRLKQQLQNRHIGVLIDNLEPALDKNGQFFPEHRRYLELLRVLSDSSLQSLTLITSRERLCEGLDITLYSLPSLTVSAWGEFWQYQGINNHISLLTEIHKAYGGNALAMKVLSNLINNDYQGDIVAYWQDNKTEDNLIVETAVANLIKEQFERLKTINLDAYNLLCRLGCYRYQDVPTVPEAGLICLLWDVAQNQHKRIIRVLKERALVEFNNGDYWLHPVIREVAIDRLRNSDDWVKANTQAAEFWTDSVKTVETVKDALTAFEAYYHYLSINDYNKASNVIIKRKTKKWQVTDVKLGRTEKLGISFLRFGLLDRLIISINRIIDHVDKQYNQGYNLAILNNLLGNCYLAIGQIQKSIKYHEYSKEISIKSEFSGSKHIELTSYFNIGICYMEIIEIEQAIQYFGKVISIAKNIKISNKYRYIVRSELYLIFLKSFSESSEQELFSLINKIFQKSYIMQISQSYNWFFFGKIYVHLKDIKQSFIMYNNAMTFAKQADYPQIKGKTLTGLAELYRIQNDYKAALKHHQESIEILDKIGAKCDLAEAYFQQALTYQQMGEQANSQEYFNKAIYLWSPQQIDAPKQIERVKKAMNLSSDQT